MLADSSPAYFLYVSVKKNGSCANLSILGLVLAGEVDEKWLQLACFSKGAKFPRLPSCVGQQSENSFASLI